ncbi:MAG: filamentous hemagglutinin family protein, partial [Verrucomicrobiales bacterium]
MDPQMQLTAFKRKQSSLARMRKPGFACSLVAILTICLAWNPLLATPVNPGGQELTPDDLAIKIDGIEFTLSENGSGERLQIDQKAISKAIIEWESFDIDAADIVNFTQPNGGAVLNRILDSGGGTEIFGQLLANGSVFLLDQNGILFGAGSRVDVGGAFIATSLDINEADFEAFATNPNGGSSQLNFANGAGRGPILIEAGGLIEAGNDIFLVAPQITNHGVVRTKGTGSNSAGGPGGTVALAAGTAVEIAAGTPNGERVRVVAGAAGNSIENGPTGVIEGVAAELKAHGGNAMGLAIRNAGTVRANSVTHEGGRVLLRASRGKVESSGSIRASKAAGAVGGEVAISSPDAIDVSGRINANGTDAGGAVNVGSDAANLIVATDTTIGGNISANATEAGVGGSVSVLARNSITVDGAISARGIAQGGTIAIGDAETALVDVNATAVLNSGASAGPGGSVAILAADSIEIDGDIRVNGLVGGTMTLGAITTGEVKIGEEADLSANGADGQGGSVSIVAEDSVEVAGRIRGVGGPNGNGGSITILSGKDSNITQTAVLDASGGLNGGSIFVDSDGTTNFDGRGLAVGGSGDGGSILVRGADGVDVGPAAMLDASGGGNGGSIQVDGGSGITNFEGTALAVGNGGVGGSITVVGSEINTAAAAVLDGSGDAGGGSVRVGGGRRGQDPNLTNAANVKVEAGAILAANALNAGNGGEVIAFAENRLIFHGSAYASGGEFSGDGGFVEVSGKQRLELGNFVQSVNVSAANGISGVFLIDPVDVEIGPAPGPPIAGSPVSNATFLNDAAVGAFLAGGSLVIQTGAGVGNGDITTLAGSNITWASAESLTFQADRNFVHNGAINATGGGAITIEASQIDLDPASTISRAGAPAGRLTLQADHIRAGTAATVAGDFTGYTVFQDGFISGQLAEGPVSLRTIGGLGVGNGFPETGDILVNESIVGASSLTLNAGDDVFFGPLAQLTTGGLSLAAGDIVRFDTNHIDGGAANPVGITNTGNFSLAAKNLVFGVVLPLSDDTGIPAGFVNTQLGNGNVALSSTTGPIDFTEGVNGGGNRNLSLSSAGAVTFGALSEFADLGNLTLTGDSVDLTNLNRTFPGGQAGSLSLTADSIVGGIPPGFFQAELGKGDVTATIATGDYQFVDGVSGGGTRNLTLSIGGNLTFGAASGFRDIPNLILGGQTVDLTNFSRNFSAGQNGILNLNLDSVQVGGVNQALPGYSYLPIGFLLTELDRGDFTVSTQNGVGVLTPGGATDSGDILIDENIVQGAGTSTFGLTFVAKDDLLIESANEINIRGNLAFTAGDQVFLQQGLPAALPANNVSITSSTGSISATAGAGNLNVQGSLTAGTGLSLIGNDVNIADNSTIRANLALGSTVALEIGGPATVDVNIGDDVTINGRLGPTTILADQKIDIDSGAQITSRGLTIGNPDTDEIEIGSSGNLSGVEGALAILANDIEFESSAGNPQGTISGFSVAIGGIVTGGPGVVANADTKINDNWAITAPAGSSVTVLGQDIDITNASIGVGAQTPAVVIGNGATTNLDVNDLSITGRNVSLTGGQIVLDPASFTRTGAGTLTVTSGSIGIAAAAGPSIFTGGFVEQQLLLGDVSLITVSPVPNDPPPSLLPSGADIFINDSIESTSPNSLTVNAQDDLFFGSGSTIIKVPGGINLQAGDEIVLHNDVPGGSSPPGAFQLIAGEGSTIQATAGGPLTVGAPGAPTQFRFPIDPILPVPGAPPNSTLNLQGVGVTVQSNTNIVPPPNPNALTVTIQNNAPLSAPQGVLILPAGTRQPNILGVLGGASRLVALNLVLRPGSLPLP